MSSPLTYRGLRFTVDTEPDLDHGAPWEAADGHGIVTEWISQADQYDSPELYQDRSKFYPLGTPERDGSQRFYDMEATIRKAVKEQWGLSPQAMQDLQNEWQAGTVLSQAVITHRAVLLDRDYLAAWCNDEWHYVGVVVTLQGTSLQATLWGVQDNDEDYIRTVARELADELIATALPAIEQQIAKLRELQEQVLEAQP